WWRGFIGSGFSVEYCQHHLLHYLLLLVKISASGRSRQSDVQLVILCSPVQMVHESLPPGDDVGCLSNFRSSGRLATSSASCRSQALSYLSQASNDVLTRLPERGGFLHHALAHTVCISALCFNFIPARIGNALHAIERPIQIARREVQRQLAGAAQLVVMGLHANQHSTLASSDIGAEFVDIRRAGSLNCLDSGSDTVGETGLLGR